MSKRKRFCAECGKVGIPLHDNFCQDCYWHHHTFAGLKKDRVEVPYCLECGSVKLSSGWTGPNPQFEIPEVIAYALFRIVETSPDSMIGVDDISDINWMNPNPEFTITYTVSSDMIPEFDMATVHLEMFVKISGGTCSTCIKKKTGSGDVTVQFRAKNRKITKEEQDAATTIAFTHAAEMGYESPDAYINDIVESYGGLDFYFGNNAVAEAFIESVRNKWIGHYEKNFKLVTEDKDERRVYAVTHLFRLPEVKIGDLVEVDEVLYLVHFISKSGIHLESLVDHHRELTKKWRNIRPVNPGPVIVRKMVVSEDVSANSYLFMDMESYNNEEISRDQFPEHLELSKVVELLEWKGKYYLIPRIFSERLLD